MDDPARLGAFEIQRILGVGGSSVVYAARRNGIDLALKVLREDIRLTESERRRFLAEADQLAKLSHPGVIHVLDAGTLPDGRPFLALPLLHGETLAARVARGPLPVATALAYFYEAAAAVTELHRAGLLHRDLKPENFFLDEEQDRLVLLDFGIARDPEAIASTATQQGQVRGTPAYMAPERFFGVAASEASEVYELAATLHMMLAGRLPWSNGADLDTRLDPQLASELAPSIAAVLRGALAVRAEARPQTVTALVTALQGRDDHDAGQATRTLPNAAAVQIARAERSPPPVAATTKRIRRRTSGIAAAVALLVAGGTAFMLLHEPAERYVANLVTAPRVIVVLDPRNVSGLEEHAWLSTAIAERARLGMALGGSLVAPDQASLHELSLDLPSPKGVTDPVVLAQLHDRVNAALVMSGSYVVDKDHSLRISFIVQDAITGAVVASSSSMGTVEELAVVVSRSVGELRTALGNEPATGEHDPRVDDSLPTGGEASKQYAEGLRCARRYAYGCAKEHLDRAVVLAPTSALAHDALAEANHAMGDDAGAKAEATRALELGRHLPEDQRLALEAHAAAYTSAWPRAVEAYTALVAKHPRDLRYALGLAEVQARAGKSEDAFATLARARESSKDPRVDLSEAMIADHANDFPREVQAAERVIKAADELGERELGAYARLDKGWALVTLGKLDAAKVVLEEALRVFSTEGNRNGTSRALLDLGTLLEQKGDYDSARKMYEDALRIARDLGNQAAIATVLLDLGQVLAESTEPNSARGRYEEALVIARAIGDINLTEELLVNLGSLASKSMDTDGARKAFDEALSIARANGHHRVICAVFVDQSNILERLGQLDKAVELGTEAVAEARKANEPAMLSQALTSLAQHLSEQGDMDGALQRFDEIQKLQDASGDKVGLVNTSTTKVSVLVDADRDGEAKQLALATLALIDPKSDPANYGWLKLSLAKLELGAKHYDAAATLLEAASDAVINAGDATLATEVRIVSAELLAGRGHLDQAHALLAKVRTENHDDEGVALELDIISATLDWRVAHDRAARARLAELAKTARSRGAGSVARQAEHELGAKP